MYRHVYIYIYTYILYYTTFPGAPRWRVASCAEISVGPPDVKLQQGILGPIDVHVCIYIYIYIYI